MKTDRFTNLAVAAFSLAVFSNAGYADGEKMALAPVRPSMAVITIAVADPVPGPAAVVQAPPPASPVVAASEWGDLKDYTFDMRAQLLAGIKQLEAKVDGQIRDLVAKRATMKGLTGTKEWDFAMKEMQDARSNLLSAGEELSKATQETWDQAKEKVGQAWVRTQEAYAKVESSTTS